MSYDTYKLHCNDDADMKHTECANCGSNHLRAGEMIYDDDGNGSSVRFFCRPSCQAEFNASRVSEDVE